MSKSPSETWAAALAELKLQMTGQTFDTWLRRSWVEEQSGSEWTIAVENAYAVDWLTNRLAGMVTRTLARYAGGPVAVRFVVGDRPDPDPEDAPPPDKGEPIIEAVREERVTVSESGALQWTDFYIKLKVAFRKRALYELKGARLSVFLCLALHIDREGAAHPGIDLIMRETGYSRPAVCRALDDLEDLGIIVKRSAFRGADEYQVLGYAWFGAQPAPALMEVKSDS